MPVGDIVSDRDTIAIHVLAGQLTANLPPSGGSAGVDLSKIRDQVSPGHGDIVIEGTSSGGTGSITVRAWLYFAAVGGWAPAGVGADGTKGYINNGSPIGETQSAILQHAEPTLWIGDASRLYLEVISPAHLATLDAWLIVPRRPGA